MKTLHIGLGVAGAAGLGYYVFVVVNLPSLAAVVILLGYGLVYLVVSTAVSSRTLQHSLEAAGFEATSRGFLPRLPEGDTTVRGRQVTFDTAREGARGGGRGNQPTGTYARFTVETDHDSPELAILQYAESWFPGARTLASFGNYVEANDEIETGSEKFDEWHVVDGVETFAEDVLDSDLRHRLLDFSETVGVAVNRGLVEVYLTESYLDAETIGRCAELTTRIADRVEQSERSN